MDKTNNFMNFIKRINNETFLLDGIIIGLALIVLGTFIHLTVIYLLAFVFIFTCYDLVGYKFALNNEEGIQPFQTPAYRICQSGFQILLIGFLYMLSGYNYKLVIAVITVHWLGFDDYLYYLLGKEKISPVLSWVMWTPLGLIKSISKTKALTKAEFIIQAIIGLALGITITLI